MENMTVKADHIYQLKISLTGSRPPIWRRVLVPSGISLANLHDVIQIAMGWTDSHMHMFETRPPLRVRGLGIPSLRQVSNEARTRLDQTLRVEKDWLRYEYDFGDGWDHRITLEKVLPADPNIQLPLCIKAKGACPPEDIGGLWGYYAAMEAWHDPAHPDHAEYREMFTDEDLDPNAYDIEDTNAALAMHFRRAA
jgi:hypothetical protein